MTTKIKPYPFQKEGVLDLEDFLAAHGGALLGDDMGLGKTLQALWLLKREKCGRMFPALVVCPASVKYNWEHTAFTQIDTRAQVLEGRTPPKGGFKSAPPQITIINPDILPAWLPHLKRVGFHTLILDECHDYGNPTSQRTKAAIDLSRVIPYRLALSGTPLLNAPGELWPTLYMVRPDEYRSLFSFADEFCKPKKQFGKWTYKGARNLPELHALLRRTCMVRRLKSEVLDQLPVKNRVVVPMDLVNREEYDHASLDFIGWLKKNFRDDKGKVRSAARAAAVTRVGYLLRLAAKEKARNVVDWANRFLTEYPEEKLVIFGIHRKMIDVLQRRINAKSVIIDGTVTGRNRKYAVDQFRKDKDTRLCIGNMRAMGVGVDGLQEVCTNAAFAEMWWVPGVLAQAEDRIYRMGQNFVSWIHYLIAGGTIEERLCEVVQAKMAVIHAALDGTEDAGDMNVFDLLIETLEREADA